MTTTVRGVVREGLVVPNSPLPEGAHVEIRLANPPADLPSERLDRAKRYHEAIHDILLREWDPIGVADYQGAQDEYDDYIHELHGMLIRHEPRHKLVNHLWWIETKHIGLFGNRSRTEAVADRLIGVRGEIETNV